nr:MAG TPA: hypothetical protein [Caudoviricetes sp.]
MIFGTAQETCRRNLIVSSLLIQTGLIIVSRS